MGKMEKPRIRKKYEAETCGALMKRFGYGNPMQVPRLNKVVLNMGLGEAIQNPKVLDSTAAELGQIAGQKPLIRKARRSIANFKLRAGMPIGCAVTLRGDRMWEFFDRLITFALPRVRDFKGLSRKAFDGRGNYSLGVQEQIIFPEVDYDKIDKIRGLNITFVTSAERDEEGLGLLELLGMPFRKQ